MPTNLYGPGDNYDLHGSHVIPALIRKAHEAKLSGAPMIVWGSGSPRREFLHVDDCADACVFLMQAYSDDGHVNVGSGEDISILDLTRKVAAIVGFTGAIEQDVSKPDGTPRKLMDVSKLRALGWQARTSLDDGLTAAYDWFLHCAGEARPERAGTQ
jgi:GDP-L-fucose synthase